MELNERIKRLLDALVGEQLEGFKTSLDQGLRDWENRLGIHGEAQGKKSSTQDRPNSHADFFGYQRPPQTEPKPAYSDQTLKDLAAFGLTPPVTLAELKKARNGELKKFHPDRFAQDPGKIASAKRITQILGDTYERLVQQLS